MNDSIATPYYFSLSKLALGLLIVGSVQAQTFAPLTAYPVGAGSGPTNVAAGDVNKDGYPDLVVANQKNSTVGVLFNKRNGTFEPVITYSTGSVNNPHGLALADINLDNYPDLIVSTSVGSLGVVLLNQQNGTFGTAVPFGVGATSHAEDVAAADVNGDGSPDLLTANGSATRTASVLLNKQNGTFMAPVSYPSGSYPLSIVAGDINADGYPDLAVADYFEKAQVFINQKDGTFAPAVGYFAGTGTQPAGIALEDVNLDGYPDLVTANLVGTISVLLNNQNGTFTSGLTYAAGGYTSSVALGDIDGDDSPDIATANFDTNTAGVLLNKRNGTFAPAITYSTGLGSSPRSVVLSDVNRDGHLDLIVANYNDNAVVVLLNTTTLASHFAAVLPGANATLSPNPASAAVTLTLTGLPAAIAQVQATLLDPTGRPVRQHTLIASQGSARAKLPVAELAMGLYMLRLAAYNAQGELAGLLPIQRLSVQ